MKFATQFALAEANVESDLGDPGSRTRGEDDQLLASVQEWEAVQPSPPGLVDVLKTGDGRLVGAYVLREFRIAAAQAVVEHERVLRIRRAALQAYAGDVRDAENFLTQAVDAFGGRTPLQMALSCERDALRAENLLAQSDSADAASHR